MSERIEARAEQSFEVPAERVYEAWLRPELIRQWLTAALQAMELPGEVIRVDVDAQVGGKFCFSDKRPPGEVFHWGTYKRLDRPACLAFTWNAGLEFAAANDDELSLVTISIEPTSTGCHARLVHSMDAQWLDFRERTERGWSNMLAHIAVGE